MDLSKYLERIELAPPSAAAEGLELLRTLHLAHRRSIVFENLDIQRGLPIRLDLESLERKIVDGGRGGYCFEQNTLFAAVLRESGFQPTTLLARVRRGPPEGWVRTHMLLLIRIDGLPWIADVGFGAVGLLEPMPLREGAVVQQGGLQYQLRREGIYWVLSMTDASSKVDDLYEFTEEPHTAADVEMANHFTSTYPGSIFRRSLTLQRATAERRTILRGGVFASYEAGLLREQPVTREELAGVARKEFGVELGPGPFLFEQGGG